MNKPQKGQTITLGGQWQCDGTVEGVEVNGMLAIPEPEGVIYVTREDAKEFFGLIEPLSRTWEILPPRKTYIDGDDDVKPCR